MMRIIHLMKREKFLTAAREFYNQFFHNGEHAICYINTKGQDSLIDSSLEIAQREVFMTNNGLQNMCSILAIAKEYDYIVFHSLLFVNNISPLLWYAPRWFMNKTIWIEWGADLYKNYQGFMKRGIDRFKESIAGFVAIFPPDIDEYRKRFPKSTAKLFYAPYCGAVPPSYTQTEWTESCLSKDKKENKPIMIQVGQSANPSLHHIHILEMLSRFKNENIQLLIPLSYGGDKKYADQVQKMAEDTFGTKVRTLRQLMPKEEYFKLTDQVDIAIFDTQRQAGLANIHKLLWQYGKVYLPRNSAMYNHFRSRDVPVCAIEDLENQSFGEFIADPTINWTLAYRDFRVSLSSIEWKVDKWKVIYDSLPRA